MLNLTPDHFATSTHPASSDNLRKPFFEWLEFIEAIRGVAVASTMLDNLASMFPDDPGSHLWNESPFFNHAIYQLLLHSEPCRGEPMDSGEQSNGMVFHVSSGQ